MKLLVVFLCLMTSFSLHAPTIKSISLSDYLIEYPDNQALWFSGKIPFKFEPFPLCKDVQWRDYPSEGFFSNLYILSIPKGEVFITFQNLPFINHSWIQENQFKNATYFWQTNAFDMDYPETIHLPGRVVVIAGIYAACYYHWIIDFLSKLAMIEMQGIEYDYLYIQYDKKFMKESLDLWGIDSSKIKPVQLNCAVKSDMFFIPTTANINTITYHSCYGVDCLLHYIINKLVANVKQKNITMPPCDKIFISRSDASIRRVLNEDDVFALFEARGFKRFTLESLSFAEQVYLFHNAKSVVSFHGSGLTNSIFCKQGTSVLEIFQKRIDASYWYFAQMLQLKYFLIDASDVQANETLDAEMPIALIEDFLKQNPDF